MQDFVFPASEKGFLSLDRVTFLVFSPSLSAWSKNESDENMKRIDQFSDFLEKLGIPFDEDFSQGSKSELFLYHYRTAKGAVAEGIDIQFGAKMPIRKKIEKSMMIDSFGSDVEEETSYTYQPTYYGLRIEYNPNKDSLEVIKPLLKYFSRLSDPSILIRFARLDLAIDYKVKLIPQLITCDRVRKYNFHGESGYGLETVYFGQPSSKYQFRIYNKKRELEEKQGLTVSESDLWRIELQAKKAFLISENPIDDYLKVLRRLHFVDFAASSGDWVLDMIRRDAMNYGLVNTLNSMPVATKKRYRKILEDFGNRDLSIEYPADVVQRDFPRLYSGLQNQILNLCGVNR